MTTVVFEICDRQGYGDKNNYRGGDYDKAGETADPNE
jgi:hypothetical protein